MSKKELIFKIRNKDDIKRWFRRLFEYGINMHPDSDFDDYVFLGTGGERRSFTRDEARRLNAMMSGAFDVAGNQVYTIGLSLIRKRLKS